MGVINPYGDYEDMKAILDYLCKNNYYSLPIVKLSLVKESTMKNIIAKDRGQDLQGFNSILLHILHNNPNILNCQQAAEVQQWLQQAILLRQIVINTDLLKEINDALKSRTYITGHFMTLADLLLFLTLYSTIEKLSFYENETMPHLCRWFRLMQNEKDILVHKKPVIFSKNSLYGIRA